MGLRLWEIVLAPTAWFAAGVAGVMVTLGWVWRGHQRRHLADRVFHLARDIAAISDTIDQDLATGTDVLGSEDFLVLCEDGRKRAIPFMTRLDLLHRMATPRLKRALELLHDEHRRTVDLRSEVDAALAASRRSSLGEPRLARGSRSKQTRSGRSSSGFSTRASLA